MYPYILFRISAGRSRKRRVLGRVAGLLEAIVDAVDSLLTSNFAGLMDRTECKCLRVGVAVALRFCEAIVARAYEGRWIGLLVSGVAAMSPGKECCWRRLFGCSYEISDCIKFRDCVDLSSLLSLSHMRWSPYIGRAEVSGRGSGCLCRVRVFLNSYEDDQRPSQSRSAFEVSSIRR